MRPSTLCFGAFHDSRISIARSWLLVHDISGRSNDMTDAECRLGQRCPLCARSLNARPTQHSCRIFIVTVHGSQTPRTRSTFKSYGNLYFESISSRSYPKRRAGRVVTSSPKATRPDLHLSRGCPMSRRRQVWPDRQRPIQCCRGQSWRRGPSSRRRARRGTSLPAPR